MVKEKVALQKHLLKKPKVGHQSRFLSEESQGPQKPGDDPNLQNGSHPTRPPLRNKGARRKLLRLIISIQ